MAGDGHSVEAIRHADMFAFLDYLESDLTESANDSFGREVSEKHLDRQANLSGRFIPGLLLYHEEISPDGVFDVF